MELYIEILKAAFLTVSVLAMTLIVFYFILVLINFIKNKETR